MTEQQIEQQQPTEQTEPHGTDWKSVERRTGLRPAFNASRDGSWRNMFVNNELEKVPGSTECEVKANVESMMKTFGDGARAVVSVFWKAPQTNGHVFIAEQVDGKTIFVDPQSGNDDCGDYFMDAEVGETQILRIDNNDLTDLVFKAVRRRRA